MNQDKLEELLNLFVEGEISRLEFDQLLEFIKNSSDEENLNPAVDNVFRKIEKYTALNKEEKELIYKSMIQDNRFEPEHDVEPVKSDRVILGAWDQLGIAASILLLVISGLYFYTNRSLDQKFAVEAQTPNQNIIVPGGDKAILTLSDGSKIILDHAKNGVLANQAGVSIQKTSNGKLLYASANGVNSLFNNPDVEMVYNKVETPMGGKYQVNLPDGSKVWLNASSSLRFPALFIGKTREVELTGEAFFDVAKNRSMPFKVITKDQIVEVLGTQFNINSYSDEGVIKTTLIEGSVKIIYKDKVVLLGPGQQFLPGASNTKVIDADKEEVLSWKNGYFIFKNEDIQSIMRKISRWYNVEVSYSGPIPGVGFGGNISRSKDISEVLEVLQLTNAVHFKVEGRRIIVMQ